MDEGRKEGSQYTISSCYLSLLHVGLFIPHGLHLAVQKLNGLFQWIQVVCHVMEEELEESCVGEFPNKFTYRRAQEGRQRLQQRVG